MASEGPNVGSSCVNDSSYGANAWSNASFALVDDTSYASVFINGNGISHYLNATNYGFSIPAGSTIDGILLTVGRFSNNTAKDSSIRLVKGGVVSGDNKATAASWLNGSPSTTPAEVTYGGPADLWGETWTVDDINAANFGAVVSVNGQNWTTSYVDYIFLTVYYTEGVGGGGGGGQDLAKYKRHFNDWLKGNCQMRGIKG